MYSTSMPLIKATWITLILISICQLTVIAKAEKKKTKITTSQEQFLAPIKPKSLKKSTTYQFIGNTYSKKYHKPGCEYARKMNVHHVLLLKTKQEAKQSRYKECNWCMPKWSKSVSSKLLYSK